MNDMMRNQYPALADAPVCYLVHVAASPPISVKKLDTRRSYWLSAEK